LEHLAVEKLVLNYVEWSDGLMVQQWVAVKVLFLAALKAGKMDDL
jgi:hypothetical protein